MEVDFDKQIDTILRDLAKGKTFAETLPKSHPDADELSAFAENALPAKARLRTTGHLADCPKCRKILTNIVLLNIEAESETIHEETKTIVTIPPIPWYRQLFAFPQLAYTMGALVLVFSGMVGYLVLQSSQSLKSDIAMAEKSSEKPMGPNGASSDGEGQLTETYASNSNTSSSADTAANVAIPAANASANSSAPASPGDFEDKVAKPQATPAPEPLVAAPTTTGPETVGKTAEKSDSDLKTNKDVSKEETLSKTGNDVPASQVTNEQKVTDETENNVSRQQVQDAPVQNRNQSRVMMPDGVAQNQRNVPPAPRKAETRRDEDDSKGGESAGERERAKKKMSEKQPEPTKTIGEKTFRTVKGIWTDSEYKGGSTTNVKRGTDDYKKLDSDLQKIGNAFSGTVIVVWSGKSYKIQ